MDKNERFKWSLTYQTENKWKKKDGNRKKEKGTKKSKFNTSISLTSIAY